MIQDAAAAEKLLGQQEENHRKKVDEKLEIVKDLEKKIEDLEGDL